MTALLGTVLGAGLLLVAAPFLWPRAGARRPSGRVAASVRQSLALAGLGAVPPVAVAVLCLLLGLVAGALVRVLTGVTALAFVAGASGFLLPALLMRRRALARRAVNRAIWPDVVDHLVSAVRSGLALSDGIGALARTGPLPTRSAFAAFEADYRASGNFTACLDRLKEELADPVADRILETLRMAREVGGSDLVAVLRGLAVYLREDQAIRSEVAGRQSWIRNAARLGVAAPWVLLLLLSTRPEAARAYDTPAGTALIIGGLAVTAVAYRLMVALGRLPAEPRWFR